MIFSKSKVAPTFAEQMSSIKAAFKTAHENANNLHSMMEEEIKSKESQIASFQSCIVGQQHILKEYHPAYYARTGEKMSHGLFVQINQLLDGMYGEKISFYKETDYGVC